MIVMMMIVMMLILVPKICWWPTCDAHSQNSFTLVQNLEKYMKTRKNTSEIQKNYKTQKNTQKLGKIWTSENFILVEEFGKILQTNSEKTQKNTLENLEKYSQKTVPRGRSTFSNYAGIKLILMLRVKELWHNFMWHFIVFSSLRVILECTTL